MTLLSVDLREGTKTLHTKAAGSLFVRKFVKGEISVALYGRFLISLYQVYNALERELEKHKELSNIQHLYFPDQLNRKPALESDLDYYNGPNWKETMLEPVSAAQQAYIDAIMRCSTTKPDLLIAHCYVRYLGDLSGGQVLAKKLQKYNDLPDGKGVAFYHFDLIEDSDQFKELFRKRMNTVEIDEETHQEIIQESCLAFELNISLLQEFDGEIAEQVKREQEEKLAAEQQEAVKIATVASTETSFLASLAPSNVINSLAVAVGLKSSS